MILIGDVREQLKQLSDQSVNCVVTSPPYWGLRDYGTASWDGGDLKSLIQAIETKLKEKNS